jgi:hypothetical protein
MTKIYIVRLSAEERAQLEQLVSKGKAAARKLTHARILLLADVSESGPGWKDERIVEALHVGVRQVEEVRRRLVMEGLEAALNRRRQCRPSRMRKLDGEKEAHLIALACGSAPDGRKRWTLRMLADKLVEMEVVDSVSHETVRQTLKKMS